ncbi:hypothetical protein SAMN05428958_1225 [Pantoea sesami]|nr:hypothetical protein SAMN05428958_1225 [Pantoea sesami]
MNTIITKNTYLRYGFLHLIESISISRELLILDIDSYPSLSEMIVELNLINNDSMQCYIIKGEGLNSKLLTHITSFSINSTLREIIKSLKQESPILCNIIISEIQSFLALNMLSEAQRKTAISLAKTRSVSSSAKILKINTKTAGSRVRAIIAKMKLESINDIRKFIITNNLGIIKENNQKMMHYHTKNYKAKISQ